MKVSIMVKQNSIRFAAQRVAQATKFSPNFKNVLLAICSQFKIRVLGLNEGPDKYSSETAPFYFEQIVDARTTVGWQCRVWLVVVGGKRVEL